LHQFPFNKDSPVADEPTEAADPLVELEATLGHRFRDRVLLTQALTHSSRKPELRCSNERMEFLGDSILGAAVSDFLYRRFPDYSEGDLTRVKSVVVSRVALARAAREMNLGKYLLVAKGVANAPSEEPDGAAEFAAHPHHALPPSILADAFEALIAAVYLDAGVEAAYAFVLRHIEKQIERTRQEMAQHNAKSLLQEFVQREMNSTPVYKVTAETGPDHVKSFEVVTLISGQPYGAGHGATKKAAEQMAAELTLEMLGQRKTSAEVGACPPQAGESAES
jgi:ribonuclease III